MSIKRYKDIASMQNPGSQRTGKAGGGRVKKQAGGRGERAPRIRGAIQAGIEEARSRSEGVGERIGGQIGIPGGAWIGRMAEKGGRKAVSGIKKRRKERKAKKRGK